MSTDAQHDVDGAALSRCPMINKVEIVQVSLVKNLLADDELPTGYRFKFLSWLDKRDCERPGAQWNDARLTREAIAAINPMCESGFELLREIMKLPKSDRLDAIARKDVFFAFVALNPSLATAVKMLRYERRAA